MTNLPKRKYFVELPEGAKITAANVNGSAEINIQYTDEEKTMSEKINLPEPTVMNWSTERPKYEDVKGKWILIEFSSENCHGKQVVSKTVIVIDNAGIYDYWFNNGFLRYAIIAEPLEAKPLWGVKPVIREPQEERWHNTTRMIQPAYPFWVVRIEVNGVSMQVKGDTEAAAITAWNELVDKIQGVR